MKKVLLVLILFVGYPGAIYAQNPLYLLEMAHKIAHPANITVEEGQLCLKPDEVATSQYMPMIRAVIGSPTDTTIPQLLDKMDANPFIGRGGGAAKIWILADAQTPLGSLVQRGGAQAVSSPGFKVSTVADGIARFLVNRTKEELSIAFFKQFKEDLKSDERLSTLFPTTTSTLLLVDDQVYQFNRYLESLRESFHKDMKTLPLNTKKYLTNNRLIPSERHQILAEDALELSQFILNGIPTDSIISWLANQAELQQPWRIDLVKVEDRAQLIDMGAGFKSLNLFSQSLMVNDHGTKIWMHPAKASEYLRDPNTRLVYLGLLWQMGENIRFSTGQSLRDYLTDLATNTQKVTDFVGIIREFAQNGENAAQAIRDLKAPDNNALYEPYFRFFQSFMELAATGIQFKTTIAAFATGPSATEQTFMLGLKHLNELQFDVRQKNYSAAICDLMYVLQYFLPEQDKEWRNKLFKYGQFIATVAEAENSEQVAAAIDAIALPPGSSRVKKDNYFSAAINAYTGLSGGGETLDQTGTRGFMALSAPVGVSVSWKLGEPKLKANGKTRTPGSFSFFAPIIDVGGLVSYRFNDPFSNDLPELKWSNLLAPGLYGVWGWGNDLPISLGIGAQRGPNLRKVSVNAVDISTGGWRYGAFLTVDIPVFNLYVQSKKNKG